jgi:hypothetical protein
VRIVPGSSGSFLTPPGHPMHFHHVEDGPAKNPNLIAGLDYALGDPYGDVPVDLQARVRALYDATTLVDSELWQRMVYGYFRNCYSPDGTNRDVGDAIIDPTRSLPPERHLAFLAVKTYFPDAEPRLDLIASGGDYGTKKCTKCGATLQYEAKVDAFAEAITAATACPSGGAHEVKET